MQCHTLEDLKSSTEQLQIPHILHIALWFRTKVSTVSRHLPSPSSEQKRIQKAKLLCSTLYHGYGEKKVL
jgi:hypothetical protein